MVWVMGHGYKEEQFQWNDVYSRHAGWQGFRRLSEDRKSVSRDLTTRSIILDTRERLEIGR